MQILLFDTEPLYEVIKLGVVIIWYHSLVPCFSCWFDLQCLFLQYTMRLRWIISLTQARSKILNSSSLNNP